jgi:hypothetical protein
VLCKEFQVSETLTVKCTFSGMWFVSLVYCITQILVKTVFSAVLLEFSLLVLASGCRKQTCRQLHVDYHGEFK